MMTRENSVMKNAKPVVTPDHSDSEPDSKERIQKYMYEAKDEIYMIMTEI